MEIFIYFWIRNIPHRIRKCSLFLQVDIFYVKIKPAGRLIFTFVHCMCTCAHIQDCEDTLDLGLRL